jgi:FkbM family methyltransferase
LKTKLAIRVWAAFGTRLLAEVVLSRVRRRAIHTPTSTRVKATRWGLKWSLNLEDNLQRRLLLAHSYEAATLFHVARRMHDDDVILDVGANVGTFLLPILRHAAIRGRGLAVEPAVDSATLLEENVRINHLDKRITIANVAFGDAARVANLQARANHDDTGMRSLTVEDDTAGTVRVTRGDEVLRSLGLQRVDVLKVDVEGGELAVLSGLDRLLRERPPRLVIVELLHYPAEGSSGSIPQIVSLLGGLGYRGWWIRYRGLQELRWGPGREGNALFARPSWS